MAGCTKMAGLCPCVIQGRLALTCQPDMTANLSMACYEDGGAMPLCDAKCLALTCKPDGMDVGRRHEEMAA